MKNLSPRLFQRARLNRAHRWWLVLLCPLLLLGELFWLTRAPQPSVAAQGAAAAVGLNEGVQRQIKALLDEKAARTAAQQKLDSQLLYALKMRRGAEIAPGIRQLSVRIETDARAKTVVDITAIVGGTLLEDLEALGAELLSVHAQYNSIRTNAPLDRLEEIAALPQVRFVQPKQEPRYLRHVARARERGATRGEELPPGFGQRAQRVRNFLTGALDRLAAQQDGKLPGQAISNVTLAGSVTSEGDVTHRAAAARTMFGVNGAGVRIGVISDGVVSLSASQAAGDLPGNIAVLPGYTGIGDEGTAMLEIINDLAPGAQLYFATAQGGVAGFAQAIRDLRAAGCDIIVDDIIYDVETPFQDGQAPGVMSTTNGGLIWQAVNDVTAAGALYFSSAGNEGNKNDNTSGTWAGDFVDGGMLPILSGGTVHNFGGGMQFNTITAPGSFAALFWADPLGGANNDYDLFVLNSTGNSVVASSTNVQNGTQDPVEGVFTGLTTNNRLVILKKPGAANRFLYLENFRGRLNVNTEGNVRGHACAANAFSVAATPAYTAFGPAPNPTGPFPNPFNSSNTVELFSSDGPRRIFFNANGTPLTPGNFSASGGLLRQKPDITAADGVMVTGAGGFPARFYGTSAAAPHAAAIAALLKSANPLLTPAQVRNALTSTALDIEGAGVDRDAGAGIVMALQALQAIGAAPAANLQIGTVAATEAGGNGNSFIEAGEGGTLNVQLLNNGLLAATSVTATLSTTTPGVNVTTANSAYPNLPATTGAGVNATLFAFTLNATAICPLRIDFVLTVNYAGASSPRVLPFTVQTGVPPLTITSTLDAVAPVAAAGFTTATGLQTARLNRLGPPISTCGVSKPCPGVTGTGTRRYDAYTFTNCATSPACISVNFSASCNSPLYAAAYLGGFNPNNVCANYLADYGQSPGLIPTNFGFTVPAGATFTIVVHEVNSSSGIGCNYTLNLAGLCCQASAGACPTVTNFTPAGAAAGGAVTINGANLTGVTGLSFGGNVGAGFTVNAGGTQITTTAPSGAMTGPLSLSKSGCAEVKTLPFNIGTGSPTQLFVDDGIFEGAFSINAGSLQTYVNRLSPFSFPATLTGVSLFIPNSSGPVPVGTNLTLIVGNNADGDTDINGTTFQTLPATVQALGQFITYNFPAFTINSGDFVVGYRINTPAGVFPAARDIGPPLQQRSYFSANGTAFLLIDNVSASLAGNLGVRARIGSASCPTVSNLNPMSGGTGTQVTLTGANFNGVSAVKFANNVLANFNVVSDTTITTNVPSGAVNGPLSISKPNCPDTQTAAFSTGVANTCPAVSNLNPLSGAVGASVTLSGANFTGVNSVKFANNVTAQFTVVNDTTITTTVPSGAASGPLTLSKPNCPDAQSASFTLIQCPTVSGLNPPSGAAGNSVTITGANFTGVTAVRFANNATAQFTVNSATSISATVPAGAATGPIAISKTGCAEVMTQSFIIGTGAPTELFVDDGSFEGANRSTAGEPESYVNRLSPFSYPATLTGVSLFFPNNAPPVGTPITLLVGNSASGNAPLDGISLLTLAATIQSRGQFITYNFPAFTITSGDFVVGFTTNSVAGQFPAALDATPPSRQRSYVAVHGLNFMLADNLGPNFTGNFGIRARIGSAACPTVSSLNPASGVVGASLTLTGANFNGVNAVRFANNVPAVFTVNSDTQITVTVPSGAASGPITISKPNCPDAQSASFTVCATLSIVPATLPAGTVGAAYNQTLVASGGTAPYNFTLNAGTVPNGLTLSATGALSGTPTQQGSFNFTIKVTDANGCMGTQSYSLVTNCPTITLSPATLPSGTVGTAYNQTVTASPMGSYNFAVTAGALPAGLSLNATTGAITGRPAAAGTANFTITATSLGLCSGSRSYTLTINQSIRMVRVGDVNGNAGSTVSVPVELLAEGNETALGLSLTFNQTSLSNPQVALGSGASGAALNINSAQAAQGRVGIVLSLPAGQTFASGSRQVAVVTFSIAANAVAGATPIGFGDQPVLREIVDATATPLPALYTPGSVNVFANPVPTLGSLNPNSATAGGPGFTLTVNGAGFVSGSLVRWNGADRPTTFASSTQLTAAIPASDLNSLQLAGARTAHKLAIAATAQVTVFNPAPGGGTSNALTFTINNPTPTLTGLNPNVATVGGAGFTLNLTGTNFVNGATVRWNGSDRATNFVSGTQLTATITAADIATAGTSAVTVFNPAPGGGVSNTLTFTINNPAPTLANLNPSSALAGGASFTLTLTGANFVNGAVVRWNGSDRATTFVSNTQLTADIPASDIVTAGTANLTVFNPAPGGGTSGALIFTINNPLPTTTALNPNSGLVGGAAFTLTVTGANFVNGAVVRWNGVDRATTVVSGTQLTAAIPASDLATAGTANVTVFNPAPGGGTSNAQSFTVNNPAPTLTGLNPNSATAGGAAFTLTVNGTNFVSGSVVRWNGAERQTTFVSSTQLAAAITAADIATASANAVTVVTPAPGGGASNALSFTVNNLAPSIANLAPSLAIVGGPGFTLTVNGANFVNDSVVRWNGNNRATTFVSATRLTAAIPASDIAAAGTARVTVFNPAPGGGASNEVTVTIANAVVSVSAASFSGAELAAASIVSAFGVGLATSVVIAETTPLPTTLGGTTVRVRDSAGVERLAPLFFVAPTQLNYLIPPSTALGAATITVTSGNGTLAVGTLQIAPVAPSLFTANATGQGVPAAVALRVKADGSQSVEPVARFDATLGRFVATPLELGPDGEQVFLILFGTGFRAVGSLTNVTARIGGVNAEVLFAGAQGGLTGVDQANLRLPRSLAGRGEVDVALTLEGKTANTVRINLK